MIPKSVVVVARGLIKAQTAHRLCAPLDYLLLITRSFRIVSQGYCTPGSDLVRRVYGYIRTPGIHSIRTPRLLFLQLQAAPTPRDTNPRALFQLPRHS